MNVVLVVVVVVVVGVIATSLPIVMAQKLQPLPQNQTKSNLGLPCPGNITKSGQCKIIVPTNTCPPINYTNQGMECIVPVNASLLGNQTIPPPTIPPIPTCSLPPLNGSIPCNNENKSI